MSEPPMKKARKGPAGPHPADAFVGKTVREGQAEIERDAGDTGAFYNPIQELNRDLSVALLTVFAAGVRRDADALAAAAAAASTSTPQERARARAEAAAHPLNRGMLCCGAGGTGGVRVLEGLAATGLRSVRYAKEVPGVCEVLANDMDPRAVASIARAAAHNGVEAVVKPSQGDAAFVLACAASGHAGAHQYEVVDLDPYGSPAPFLDAAVRAVADGGLLCVTFTDMAVLCGAHSEACYSKYGSVPLHQAHNCHEYALRIGVAAVAQRAACYRRCVRPLLCVSVDYYMRLFLRITTAPRLANALPQSLAHVIACPRCTSFRVSRLCTAGAGSGGRPLQPCRWDAGARCDVCGGTLVVGGPVWADPLHDQDWVRAVLDHVAACPPDVYPHTRARINAMLGTVLEELPDAPLFVALDALCHALRISMPPRRLVEQAFKAAGHRLSMSHTNPQALKTDAPPKFVWALLKKWAPDARNDLAAAVYERLTDDFGIDLDAAAKAAKEADAHKKKQKRFLPNPERNWGPATRAGKKKALDKDEEEHKDDDGKEKGKEEPKEEEEENKYHSVSLVNS